MPKDYSTTHKKRVLYFVPEFPRLTETFIERELTRLLQFDKLDIQILSLAKASGQMSDTARAVVTYKKMTLQIALMAFIKYLLFRPQNFINVFPLILGEDKEPIFFTRIIYFLKGVAYAELFSRYKPEHVHVHFLSNFSTIAMVAAAILKVPFSVSAHARDVFVDGSLIQNKVKNSKFLTICNRRTWNQVLTQAPENLKSKVKLIYHGIDHARVFGGPSRIPKPSRPVIFLGGTRLVEKKGIRYIIEASKILKDRGFDHQVEIVGPGPLYSEILAQIKDLGLENNIFVRGEGNGTPFDIVVDYYKIADYFVFPSIETSEGDVDGVPTVIIEAALAKLPIITTSAGSITDLISNENTGIIVAQRDSAAIAEQILRLSSDTELRQKLIQNAFSKASQMFDLDKNIGELQELLLS